MPRGDWGRSTRVAKIYCENVGGKNWVADTRKNEILASNLSKKLVDLTAPGTAFDVSIVCLQEVNAALAAHIADNYLGANWEVAHMAHVDLFTAWRREASTPNAPEATWEAITPVRMRPLWELGTPGQCRWWRGYLEARGRVALLLRG